MLIAARPGQVEVKAAAAARAFDYPAEKLEIIVARGKQPSVQRNAGLRAARGELIYFLDDDSVAQPGNLRRNFLDLLLGPAADYHLGPGPGQPQGDGPADAATAAGDDGDFPAQIKFRIHKNPPYFIYLPQRARRTQR